MNWLSMYMTTLTFIEQEEWKETEEHERLEVVHGIDGVLKAWKCIMNTQG